MTLEVPMTVTIGTSTAVETYVFELGEKDEGDVLTSKWQVNSLYLKSYSTGVSIAGMKAAFISR